MVVSADCTAAARIFRLFSGLLLALAVLPGCGAAGAHSARPTEADGRVGPVNPLPVDDRAFAPATYRLVVGAEPEPGYSSLLSGVVARQLERARGLFEDGHTEAGFASLKGAFLLMRRGEFRREGLRGGAVALEHGATEAARLGLEGYALALYTLLEAELPEGARRDDVVQHLRAMASFAAPSSDTGPVTKIARRASVSTERALLESSDERVAEATRDLVELFDQAQRLASSELPVRLGAEREEVYRALQGTGASLVALHVRHGDPLASLVAMDEAGIERAIPANLRAALEVAAEDNDPDAWYALYRFFVAAEREGQAMLFLDPELSSGASLGAALSLFRAEPGSYRGSMPLASRLTEQGMAEVAPLVLGSGLARGASAEQLSAALALILNATIGEFQLGRPDAARRTFDGAAPLIALAESQAFVGRVSPSAARMRYALGVLEADRGELARAAPLLSDAVAREPSVDAFKLLAAIARQSQRPEEALRLLERARALAERQGDAIAEADLLRLRFEVLRDQGDKASAARALEAALDRALDATRQVNASASLARAERQLARVLEHYGDRSAVRRATSRAFDAAATDARELSATVIDSSRRAITRGDLPAARSAARLAVDSSLPADDLVYVAIWLRLLETQFAVPSDGTVEEAFAAIDDASGWIGKLRAWGRGTLDDDALLAAADTAVERIEARFYVAMAKRARGEKGAYRELEAVARGETVNLVEIGIARDVLALRAGAESFLKLPGGVALP